MRVAIGLVNLSAGGTEYQMCLLAQGLRDRGHEVLFYLQEDRPDGHMLTQFPPFPGRITTDRGIRSASLRFLVSTLEWRSWLKADQIDVAIGGLALPHLLLGHATNFLGIPVVGRRGFAWEEVIHLPEYRRVGRYLRMVHRWTAHRTARLVCNAPHVAASAERFERWPSSKIHLIRNGWPERDPIDWTSTQVLYAARGRAEKGHDGLAQKLSPDLRLAYSFAVPEWSKVGICLHPSLAEGCSNSIGMSMAHAIPVVAFNTPGNRALMDGSGLLIDPGDYQAMSAHTLELVKSDVLRKYWGARGFQRVRSEFPLKTMVDQWESLLKEVVACRSH